jgi:hypothetical protein
MARSRPKPAEPRNASENGCGAASTGLGRHRLEFFGEEIVIVRSNHKIARLIPGPPHMTVIEAMADIYQPLPPDAGKDWIEDSRKTPNLTQDIRDPWDF